MEINKKLIISLILFVVLTAVMHYLDETPPHIIPFEFAKTADNAKNIVEEWNLRDVLHLKKLSIYIDYFYLIVYSMLLFLLLKRNGVSNKFILSLPFFAAVLDFIENTCLLPFLYHSGNDTMAHIAFYAACIKFGIIVISVLIILFLWMHKIVKY